MSTTIYRRAIAAHHQRVRSQEDQEAQRVKNQIERASRLVEEKKGVWASEAGLRLFQISDAPETSKLAWFVLEETKEAWELHGPTNSNARERTKGRKETQPFYVGAAIDDNIVIILRLGTPGLEVRPGLFVQIEDGPIEAIEGLADLGEKLESAGFDGD